MKISEIVKRIEKVYPIETALENDMDKIGYEVQWKDDFNVESFIATLDVTPKIVDYAVSKNIKLIVTHHPLFYNGIEEEVRSSQYKNELLSEINKNKITIYAAHTNADVGEKGLSFHILKKIGITPRWILDKTTKLGAVAYLEERLQLGEIVDKFVHNLDIKYIKYFRTKERDYSRIAFVSGAGSSLINEAIRENAELFITSDIPWHVWTQLQVMGIDTIEVSHSVENEFVTLIDNIFDKNEITILKAHVQDLTKYYAPPQ